jgi:hypothetical protein
MTDRVITFSIKGPKEELDEFEQQIQMIQTLTGVSNPTAAVTKSILLTSQVLNTIYSTGRFLTLVKKPKRKHIVFTDESEVLFNIRKLAKENRKEKKKKNKKSPK